MREVVIVEAARTPVGRFRGGLKQVRADHLGAAVLGELHYGAHRAAGGGVAGVDSGYDGRPKVRFGRGGDARGVCPDRIGTE